MTEEIEIWLPDEKKSLSCGASLSRTLYTTAVTVLCVGEPGAGKTTFLQGVAQGLGISGYVTSPTFALEQRYTTAGGLPFLHLDLYRLSPADAATVVRSAEETPGIRCIEWADRLPSDAFAGPVIRIALREAGAGRRAHIVLSDIALPHVEQIRRWHDRVHLPRHIRAHADAVAAFGRHLSDMLLARGSIVRREAMTRSALVHDLLRFLDFRPGAGPPGRESLPSDEAAWQQWRRRYEGLRHEEACARFLTEEGYPDIARIVAVHGLTLPSPERRTIEQQLLFYADKRVVESSVVSLQERFDDFHRRYSTGTASREHCLWYGEAMEVERSLFPEGAPAPPGCIHRT